MFYLVNAAWDVFKVLSTGIDVQTKVNAVTYITEHLEGEGYDTAAQYLDEERPVVDERIQYYLRRHLNHKRYQGEHFPDKRVTIECKQLEDTLTIMKPIRV